MDAPADRRAEQLRAHLSASDLHVFAGTDLDLDARAAVDVLVIDDARLGPTDTPARLREIADSSVVVIATIPYDILCEGRAGSQVWLRRPWADICDLAIHLAWPPDDHERAGEVDLSLLENRHGPLMDEVVAFQGHYARFRELRRN